MNERWFLKGAMDCQEWLVSFPGRIKAVRLGNTFEGAQYSSDNDNLQLALVICCFWGK